MGADGNESLGANFRSTEVRPFGAKGARGHFSVHLYGDLGRAVYQPGGDGIHAGICPLGVRYVSASSRSWDNLGRSWGPSAREPC